VSNGSQAAYVDSDVMDSDVIDSKIKSSSDGGDPGEGDSGSETSARVPTLRCIGCDCGFAAAGGAICMLVEGVRLVLDAAPEEPLRGKK